VLDVGAGDEGLLPRPREDHHARARLGRHLLQSVAQLVQRRQIERVQRLLPVNRDDGDAVFTCDVDQTGILPFRKSTISDVGAPGVNTSATPCCFSSSESSRGIVPPTTTSTSSAPFAFNPSTMRGTSVMCAPD